MKETVCTLAGCIGAAIASFFGGWDAALTTLIIFMATDYITGLLVAGVFKKSEKTTNGGLDSRIGWRGLCKKGVVLLFVLVAYRLDLTIGTNYIRNSVIIGFIVNELISVTENAGLMGMPLPNAIKKGIEILQSKENEENGD